MLLDELVLELKDATPWEALIEGENRVNGQLKPPAWDPNFLRYTFTLFSHNWRLFAPDYDGRSLDWHDFVNDGRPGNKGTSVSIEMVPGQLQILGAPESRWWEIEDVAAYFDLDADPEPNVLSMVLPEFFYLDVKNWYTLPTPIKSGKLRDVQSFEMVDSFGVVTECRPLIPESPANKPEDDWAMFTLSGEADVHTASGAIFFAPNIATSIGQNDLVEEVRMLRDENANLVWEWERQLTDETGELFFTYADAARAGGDLGHPPAQGAGADDLPKYRLMSEVPRAWIPYLPRHTAEKPAFDGGVTLRRARAHEDFTRANPQYRGEFLSEAVETAEEEVPLTGLTLKRRHRFTRDAQGNLKFWVGRSRDVAPQSPRPGLRFDYLANKKPS